MCEASGATRSYGAVMFPLSAGFICGYVIGSRRSTSAYSEHAFEDHYFQCHATSSRLVAVERYYVAKIPVHRLSVSKVIRFNHDDRIREDAMAFLTVLVRHGPVRLKPNNGTLEIIDNF